MANPLPFLEMRGEADARIVQFTRADMTDAAFIKTVGDELYRLLKPLEAPKVVLDFGKVERLSSATLGMLVALNKVISRQNGQLRIANVAEHLVDIFGMTLLDRVLVICDSAEMLSST